MNSKGDFSYLPYTVEQRLESYKNAHWPFDEGSCVPLKLAEAGFVFVGDDSNPDQVKCIVCQCEVDCWEECDDPFAEHKGAEPKCPLVKMKNPYKPLTLGDVLKLEKKANEFLMTKHENKLKARLRKQMEEYLH